MTVSPPTPHLPESDTHARHQRRAALLLVAYIATWVLEGALRKWVLPSAQEFLYFVRVPIVAAMVWNFLRSSRGSEPTRAALLAVPLALVVAFSVLSVWQGQSLASAGFGARLFVEVWIVPLCTAPLLSATGVRAALRCVCILTPAMTMLALVQVTNPSTAFINRIFASEGRDNFINVGDTVRATGTFTSALGLSLFAALSVAAAAALFSDATGRRDKLLASIAGPSAGILVLSSGSRTAVLSCIVPIVLLIGLQASRRPQSLARSLTVIGATVLAGYYLVPRIAPAAAEGLSLRFAIDSPADLLARGLGGLVGWVPAFTQEGALGVGLGALSLGASTVTGGASVESELERWVYELGAPAFTVALALRWILSTGLLRRAYTTFRQTALLAPVAFTGVGLSSWLLGQITGQGSANGFAAITATVAAARVGAGIGSGRKGTARSAHRLPTGTAPRSSDGRRPVPLAASRRAAVDP